MIATSYQLIAISGSAVVTSSAPLSEGLTVERQLHTNFNTPAEASCWRSAAVRVFLSVNVDWVGGCISLGASPRAASLHFAAYKFTHGQWPPLQSVWYPTNNDAPEFLFPSTTHCCAVHSGAP